MGKIVDMNGKTFGREGPLEGDVPPGDYVCRLKEVSAYRVEGGFLLKSKFNIQEGPYKGRNIFSYASFTDKPVKVRHNMPKEKPADEQQVQGNQDQTGG